MRIRDDALRNMSFYHNFKSEHVVSYKILDPFNTLVKLDDGSQYIFNEETTALRRLPDPNNMTDDEYRYEFGKTLERILYYKNISQVRLSNMTGIPQPTISSYIKGHASPTFRNLDRIAKALNCSMDTFRYMEI